MSTLNGIKNDIDPFVVWEAPNLKVKKSLDDEGSGMDEISKVKAKNLSLKTIPTPQLPYPQ